MLTTNLPALAKYLVTAQFGQYSYSGDPVTAMNNRVVSTPTLDAKYKLGIAKGFVASAQFNLGASKFVFDTSISRFQEGYSFSSELEDGPSVKTSFAGTQATFAIGTQIYPVAKAKRRDQPGESSRPAKKGKSKFEFYANLFGGGGVFLGQHEYKYIDPVMVTEVSYTTRLTHWVYGSTLRLGTTVIPNLDFIVDLSGYTTSLYSSSHVLHKLTIDQQDQRYAPEKAGLKSLTDRPFRIFRLAIGLAFTP